MTTKNAWKKLCEQLAFSRRKAEELGWKFLERDDCGNCIFRQSMPDACLTLIVSDPLEGA